MKIGSPYKQLVYLQICQKVEPFLSAKPQYFLLIYEGVIKE